MAKLDKAKEYIGVLKMYLGLITALIISDLAGVAKLFNSSNIGVSFWLGIVTLVVLTYSFGKLSRYTHKKINELEDL